MIVCPKCNNQNPEGATQCEACLEPLPSTTQCPSCGETVQTDATFCGQCGYNLKPEAPSEEQLEETTEVPVTIVTESENPVGETSKTKEVSTPSLSKPSTNQTPQQKSAIPPTIQNTPDEVAVVAKREEKLVKKPQSVTPELVAPSPPPSNPLPPELKEEEEEEEFDATVAPGQATVLQIKTAKLLHVQTNKQVELPHKVMLVHIGKPNDQVPPHIDVSGFPNSDVVSRIHADIRVEEGNYFIEDVGSTNGTYINHSPLPVGNRHKLKAGDRIALGKEDKVTFIFQIS